MSLRKNYIHLLLLAALCLPVRIVAQDHHDHSSLSVVSDSDAQPLLAQALRLDDALSFLGSPLLPKDDSRLTALKNEAPNAGTIKEIQEILDPYCLAVVNISPEARVKVDKGAAAATLTQNGWTSFLVKIYNDAGVNAQLKVESPNSVGPVHQSSGSPVVKKEDIITPGEVASRFLDAQMYYKKPMLANLSGLKLEYAIVQIYSKDAGQREAELGFNIGKGTEDTGFRNATNILFNVRPAVKVNFHIKDDDGSPAMASFVITDSIERDAARYPGIYPDPLRRVAAFDEYPDFFFEKQVYRNDGENVELPAGKYSVTYSRGPQYIPQTKQIVIPAGVKSFDAYFQLKRWINTAKLGWYSADHHVHAAGCSHYDSPEEGVTPAQMLRQALGEDLNISAVLSWGPCWYHQKMYFTGKDDPVSAKKNIMHYDVEVSGFPSSHAGHVVLLGLKEDDYPGTTKIEQWPSWTLPVLLWARSQGAIVGYAHSGWGLEPVVPTEDLPNYVMPKMDGIGANEYIVTVTQKAVDFYSLGDTPSKWELNMLYHSWNCGFKTKVSGETDFPCITDMRVGLSRSYFKSGGPVNYDNYVAAVKAGRCYVSEGGSHIMDFAVNGQETGTNDNEIKLNGKKKVTVTANVAAYLPETTKEQLKQGSYWNIEWARIGESRNVRVELIVDGRPVDTVKIVADGKVNKINFTYPVDRSSWMALRIWGSSHTNAIFITVDGKPIHEIQSAEWCRKAVDQCWEKKSVNIRPEERDAAKTAYDKARKVYDAIIKESSN